MWNVVEIEQQLFYSITALIWQLFTTESEEPLEIIDSDSSSSSLYLCESDSFGLNQESQILDER